MCGGRSTMPETTMTETRSHGRKPEKSVELLSLCAQPFRDSATRSCYHFASGKPLQENHETR